MTFILKSPGGQNYHKLKDFVYTCIIIHDKKNVKEQLLQNKLDYWPKMTFVCHFLDSVTLKNSVSEGHCIFNAIEGHCRFNAIFS